jgi:NAD(P)-dependent dehydrogenase (short-subunit alcohol dehydrogenase family)
MVTDGEIDVFVHSLSGASLGPALAQDERAVARTFNLLAHSFLWWTQELVNLKLLSARGAHLLALSNPCPDFYLQNTGVIGAAKAALEAYVRALAVELGPRWHQVNAMRFSTVLTPALLKVLGPEAVRGLEQLHQRIVPANRIMTAGDVADLVALHLKDRWTNGAILDATGGATLTLMDKAFHG